jgi:hypothetical protein
MTPEYLIDHLSLMVTMMPEVGATWTYNSMYDYALDRAKFAQSTPLTEQQLERLEPMMRHLDEYHDGFAEYKNCFMSSQLLMRAAPHFGLGGSLSYVEGYAVTLKSPLPALHAWVEYEGSVVDVTWRSGLHNPVPDLWGEARVLGDIPEGAAYFGVTFKDDEVVENIVATESYTSLIDCWMVDWKRMKEPRINPQRDTHPLATILKEAQNQSRVTR